MGHHQVNQRTCGNLRRKTEREKGAEKLLEEVMDEKFLNLMKDMNTNMQEA